MTLLEEIISELNEALVKSTQPTPPGGTKRGGEYRIGLTKAIDICANHLELEKQQLIDFAEFVATYPDKNKNYKGEILHAKSKYDGSERTIDLLEIWKK